MIDLASLVHIIITLIVAGLIFYLLNWLIVYVGLPEPFLKIARVVLAVFAVLVVVGILLSLAGGVPLFR